MNKHVEEDCTVHEDTSLEMTDVGGNKGEEYWPAGQWIAVYRPAQ